MNTTDENTDWKEIAMALGQRVNFAVTYCECKGSGLLNEKTGQIQAWRDYMAEALEMIPGIKVDREMMATFSLPASKRRKAQQEIKARREAEKQK